MRPSKNSKYPEGLIVVGGLLEETTEIDAQVNLIKAAYSLLVRSIMVARNFKGDDNDRGNLFAETPSLDGGEDANQQGGDSEKG